MRTVSRAEVERIAHLARIRVSGEEADALAKDLGAMLEYVALLEQLDTTGVTPTATVIPLATPLRADEPGAPLAPEAALMNAPAADGSAFAVPKVLSGEEEG